jgi:hypothetical protein
MKQEQSHAHHYVPQWYQKRFLPRGVTNFFYLDLQPETVTWKGGSHQRKAVRRLGPSVCFRSDDLYTVKLGNWTTDQIERSFFGAVDVRGREAVAHFADYTGISEPTWGAGRDLVPYMDAQKFRTPKGLDLIRKRTGNADRNAVLFQMQTQFEFSTMWMEGVWEIVRATLSPTKFLLTDDPVTFYCKTVFPSEWIYPNEMSPKQIGTRTIFPLALDSCIIITHVQLVRDPWSTPTEMRTNARSYEPAMKHLGDIQFGREIEEDEVLRVNYILKKRAVRYIAAAEEEWLYPERHASTTDWGKLDNDWFLFPHLWKVPFHREIVIGHRDGRASAWDEYGRRPWQHGFKDERQRDREWGTCELAKRVWAKKRAGKSRASVDERLEGGVHGVPDRLMDEYLENEGAHSTSS